ncbi:MAG: thioredoxin TrxC [Burkholderiales bacterium]|nr:thioredoxin TrxC [Burkholderiales bacterium]
MGEDALHVVCARCAAVNRIPTARLEEGGTCGRCRTPLLDGQPAVLEQASFDTFIARNDLPVVVDFWAPWCGPCRMMAPAFEQVAREERTRARLAKVDTDAQQALAARFGIRSIPTLIRFQGGSEVDRVAGALDARSLRAWIRRS